MRVCTQRSTILSILGLAAAALPPSVQADIITGAIWSGSGIGATGGWRLVPGAEGLMVSWDIQEIAGAWRYHYTITNGTGGPLASNRKPYTVVLGLAPEFTSNDWWDVVAEYETYEVGTWNYERYYGQPGSLFGGVFRRPIGSQVFEIAFSSNWAPGPQNIYAADGTGYGPGGSTVYVWAWNEGGYIQAPSISPHAQPTPSPAAAVLGGIGLMILTFVRRRGCCRAGPAYTVR